MSACQHLPGCLCTVAAVPLADSLPGPLSLSHSSLSLPRSHLMARAGSLAPPAGMSVNTAVTEYAVCDLRTRIPVITDGPDREISPMEFLNIKSIYLVYTKIYIIQVYTWYILSIYTQKVYTWHIPNNTMFSLTPYNFREISPHPLKQIFCLL